MPFYTPTYGLIARLPGESLSASADQTSMKIIDSQLGFLTDLIGDGVINGWIVTSDGTNINISAGFGFINRFDTRTFGNLSLPIPASGKYYLFMQRKLNFIGTFSDFSNKASLYYVDDTGPSNPTGLTTTNVTYDSISLKWNAVSDRDLAFYAIFRNTDNATWINPIATTAGTTYTDTGLEDLTTYYYRIYGVDLSGNLSDGYASLGAGSFEEMTLDGYDELDIDGLFELPLELIVTPFSVKTLTDTRAPTDPTAVSVRGFNTAAQVQWFPSTSPLVQSYEITVQLVNSSGQPIASPFTHNVSSYERSAVIDNIANGKPYQFTVRAVSMRGYKSNGITVTAVPQYTVAPDEIKNLLLYDRINGTTITLYLSWHQGSDSLNDPASRYAVTIYNNQDVATTIYTANKTLDISAYVLNQKTVAVKQNTDYVIKVQAIDSAGRSNVGVIGYITTNKYFPPAVPTSGAVVMENNASLMYSWTNSTDTFSYNLVSVTQTTISVTPVTTLIVSNLNVGTASTYLLDSVTLQTNMIYTINVSAVDSAGNISQPLTITYTINGTIIRPAPPSSLSANGNTGEIDLIWATSATTNVQYYRVWRAVFSGRQRGSDFTLLDQLPSTAFSFTDYEVNPTIIYAYCVTTVDTYGNESTGPNNGKVSSAYALGQSGANDTILDPTGLVAVQNGYDVDLTWDMPTDFFDGITIWRSIGNLHSWTQVGNVDATTNSFVDAGALLLGNVNYYYHIQKYRNEATPILEITPALPVNCVALANLVVNGSDVDVDQTPMVIIKDIRDPIIKATLAKLAAHKHLQYSDTDDRRINLSSDWVVTDWTTVDFVVYTTGTDISQTNEYIVLINNIPTDIYYQMDLVDGQITFSQRLLVTDVVSVLFENVDEVQNILPANRIAEIYAESITIGTFEPKFLPQIDHDGKYKRQLLVQTTPLLNAAGDDTIFDSTNKTLTFYDVLSVGQDTGNLLVATSQGIQYSGDFGSSFTKVFNPSFPVTNLYYSEIRDQYFAYGFKGVYVAGNVFTNWTSVDGLDGINIVRDLVEDYLGNLYVSTDMGVYFLDYSDVEQVFVQKAIFNHRTTQTFAMMTIANSVFVSTEIGIFVSYDDGNTWTLSTDFQEQRPVYSFAKGDNSIFALTSDRIWRKSGSSQYTLLAVLNATQSRKMTLWRDRLYVTTDSGCVTSLGNVYTDDITTFENILADLMVNDIPVDVTLLQQVGTRLFLGSDKHLWSSSAHGVTYLSYDEGNYISPSFFVDGVRQVVGVFYGPTNVCFDYRLAFNDVVTAAQTYTTYVTDYGGWTDPNAPVTVYVSNVMNVLEPNDPNYPWTVNNVNGTFTFGGGGFGKYDVLQATVGGITLLNAGTITHAELDDYVEMKNSGLPMGMAVTQQANNLKLAMFTEETYQGQRAEFIPPFQAGVVLPCQNNWYDSFDSKLAYKLEATYINQNVALVYTSTAIYVPETGKVLAGGLGGIVSIDISTFEVQSVFSPTSTVFVRNMTRIGNIIYALTDQGVFQLDPITQVSTKDDGYGLPSVVYGIVPAYNNLVVGASDGVYVRQLNNNAYIQTLTGVNFSVYNFGDAIMAIDSSGNVYSSVSGNTWNSKGNIGPVNAVVNLKSNTFVGTQSGLVQDNSTFYAKTMKVTSVNISNTNPVNDLFTDGQRVAAAFSDGTYYIYNSGEFVYHNETPLLETIHKIIFVGSDTWLFGYNILKVASTGLIYKVATGSKLTNLT